MYVIRVFNLFANSVAATSRKVNIKTTIVTLKVAGPFPTILKLHEGGLYIQITGYLKTIFNPWCSDEHIVVNMSFCFFPHRTIFSVSDICFDNFSPCPWYELILDVPAYSQIGMFQIVCIGTEIVLKEPSKIMSVVFYCLTRIVYNLLAF